MSLTESLNDVQTDVEILLAQPRGFCAGVDRAIEIVERAIKLFGAVPWPAMSFLTNLPHDQMKSAHHLLETSHGLLAKLAYARTMKSVEARRKVYKPIMPATFGLDSSKPGVLNPI